MWSFLTFALPTAWLCRPALGISLPRDYIAMGHQILWNALIFQNPWHDPIWKATMLRLVQKETQQNGELSRRILSLSRMSRQHPGEDMESVGLPPSSTVASGPSFLFVPHVFFKMKVKEREATQSCLTLCDPMDCSLPGSSIHGIFQARILEWVAISFSRRSSRPRDWTRISCIVGRCFTIWAT